MLSPLKEVLLPLKPAEPKKKREGSVSDGLLSKYADIAQKGKTSTEFVREQRATAYGKVKKETMDAPRVLLDTDVVINANTLQAEHPLDPFDAIHRSLCMG